MTDFAQDQKAAARRESRYQKLCADIERWQRKMEKADRTLVRAIKTIAKLERQRRRMEKARTEAAKPRPEPDHPRIEAKAKAIANALVVGHDIPDFLQRQRDRAAEAMAAIEVRAEQEAEHKRKAELSRERAKVKKEIKLAELTGKRRKMPLSGKAALDAILSGPAESE